MEGFNLEKFVQNPKNMKQLERSLVGVTRGNIHLNLITLALFSVLEELKEIKEVLEAKENRPKRK